jgi:photosystem II stability/assembly factor-like uncharacterized protein
MRILLLWVLIISCYAQTFGQIIPTDASTRKKGYEQKLKLRKIGLFNNLPAKSIGPSIFSGRVVDIDVNPSNPTQFLVAYASGGLWYTNNNGQSFEPLFDQEAVMTIGDIAANWKDSTIFIGTGENNSSRSSYAGMGIYHSENWGKTWTNLGLEETQHIGRIILHPSDPQTIWVAAIGKLYSNNPERGIFQSSDAGKTWQKTLYINDSTGIIDLVMDPNNSDRLWAAAWDRQRKAWHFKGAGVGSGIYLTENGGKTWELQSTLNSGLPVGKNLGRIGLESFKNKNGTTTLLAILDNQNPKPEEKKKTDQYMIENFRSIDSAGIMILDNEKFNKFLRDNDFEKSITSEEIKSRIKSKKLKPSSIIDFLEDANSNLFNTKFFGSELYTSEDFGKTWKKTHQESLDDLFFSYGYYFGQVRVDPSNPDNVYILGVPILKSKDAGKTFSYAGAPHVHADHHALWINPNTPGHLINGNDGGINISYDNGAHWNKCNSPAVGQFYTVAADNAEPVYKVYGGVQDNGVWMGPSNYEHSYDWHASGQYPYKELMGGDGMQVAIDPRDNKTVYTGYQFGNYYRMANTNPSDEFSITPKHSLGEKPIRFNWQTPILLSKHNPDIVYFGGQKIFRSFNKGETWEPISGDLTDGAKIGNVPFGTITCLHESSRKFNLIYCGTDDGNLYKYENETWKSINPKAPKGLWVSRIKSSLHKENRVLSTLNGYRQDHFEPYVFLSNDKGETWADITSNLPKESVNVIIEDPKKEDVFYLGTDHGLYISMNTGKDWMPLGNLPNVPVHDLVIQEKNAELIVATHGRSLYKIRLKEIQEINFDSIETGINVFKIYDKNNPIGTLKFSSSWGKSWSKWFPSSKPEWIIPIYQNKQEANVEIKIKNEKGEILNEYRDTLKRGFNYLDFTPVADKKLLEKITKKDPKFTIEESPNGKYYLPKGKYILFILEDKVEKNLPFTIE